MGRFLLVAGLLALHSACGGRSGRTPRCGDGIVDSGEQCDTAGESATCNADCTVAICGDGIVNAAAGEQCDTAGQSSTCNANCTVAICGDGIVNTAAGEVCDDGNTVNETSCGYGVPTCTACSSTCTILSLAGPYCGDGIVQSQYGEQCDTAGESAACNADCTTAFCGDGKVNATAGEVCDDGNTVNETSCGYGVPTCTACNSTCSAVLSLTGPYCGDGIVQNVEACDDGNTDACGTCSAGCTVPQPAAAAAGSITTVAASALVDGESVTLGDGIHPATTFEFDTDGVCGAGTVCVPVAAGDTDTSVANALRAAVNGVLDGLFVTAGGTGNAVALANDQAGSHGNVPITTTVGDPAFAVLGMAGGSALDCPAGVSCAQPNDCLSGVCTGGACQAATCSDGVRNGDETGIDCGGSVCPACL